MEEHATSWIRVRGIGRERLARYVAEFLTGAGYKVEERSESSEANPASLVLGTLSRPNPAVPASLAQLRFRTSPTAGGCLLRWEEPTTLSQAADQARALRFATELLSNLEQRVALESRGQAKITKDRPVPPFAPLPVGTPARAPSGGSATGTAAPRAAPASADSASGPSTGI